MSPKLQVKLLRVLQEHTIERVGGDKVISVDIRVITATHVDLAKAVEDGRFREDLYYRLNVIPITMPPLRERLDDLPLLTNYFLTRFRETRFSEVTSVDPEAMKRLLTYNWPGNVRELENLVERMVTLADENILTLEDLPAKLMEATEGKEPPQIPVQLPEAEQTAPKPAPEGQEVAAPSAVKPDPVMDDGWAFPGEGLDFNALVSAYEEKLIRGALEVAGGSKIRPPNCWGLTEPPW